MSGYFHHRGVFQTPQTERLPAFFSVAERWKKVKSFQKKQFFHQNNAGNISPNLLNYHVINKKGF